jgi:hypothetical protein
MKHLKQFKIFEAVIMPDKLDNDTREIRSFEDAVRFGEENNFDVVDYDTFYNSLSERNKKTAPPRVGVPFFALFNPNTNRPMFVLSDKNAPRFIPDFKDVMIDIIGHEKVHQGQNSRRDIEFALPDPTKRGKYFSNKDEIMAFSWTIANGLSKRNDNMQDAIKDLDSEILQPQIDPIGMMMRPPRGMAPPMPPPGPRVPQDKMMWSDIKRNCDEKTIKRYRKYIYMYLEKMFDEK